MTVLLIDGVGRVQEREVSELVPEILVALPRHVSVFAFNPLVIPTFEPVPVARFRLTNELSVPPVYRMVAE